MALNTVSLKTAIKNLLQEMVQENDSESGMDTFADKLSKAMETFVKSGTVNTTVTGTCATPAGAGTISGNGTGTIS